ncbi:MAG TPA: hypothetical protein VHD56_19455 [Tepidisphaeraceae bacterium]|nr:hypothetical protein [Tepidisphaeraceae bacterium]
MVWGLHPLDAGIVITFLIAILAIGVWVARSVKHEADFFLSGRKMGKTLQFFLSFGNATDSNGAVQISSEVFRQGMGGIWLNFQALFITPFFWFTQVWFRRIRLVTMADLFVDRFNSKALATVYSLFSILIALLTLGAGNLGTYKVSSAMIVKDPAAYNEADRLMIQQFQEYNQLKSIRTQRPLTVVEAAAWDRLDALNAQGKLQAFISYLSPLPFYLVYSGFVAIYIMLGGLKAAAITDTIQGLLILAMSIVLIPLGLNAVGGVHGLHASVPAFKFYLVGTSAASDYNLLTIIAITFTSLIQIFGLMHNMSIGGSAKDEDTARFGMISGGFTKRFVLMGWAFCGLLGVAILTGSKSIADPDHAWGNLSRELLPTGLMGIMLSGLMLGHMPAVGVACVAVSGLFTRNVYRVLVPGQSEKHYTRVSQIAIGAILLLSILPAFLFTGVIAILSEQIAFNAYFGAAVFLVFFWRRLTAPSILIGVVIWVVFFGIVPLSFSHISAINQKQSLLVKTQGGTTQVEGEANATDVAEGRATQIGQPISNSVRIVAPVPCFFERIIRIDPSDPNSAVRGDGRFQVEAYVLHLLRIPVEKFTSAGLKTTRWLFDGLFPFIMMIVFSWMTRPDDSDRADRFYVKLKTPIAPTPELDVIEVRKSFEDPHRFDCEKLLPGTNWEFTKWTTKDFVGFFGCWAIVGIILAILWLILNVGA